MRRLMGNVEIPPSKSLTHRAIICASFAGCRENVRNLAYSDDILTTALAMEVIKRGGSLINCNESATTMRLLGPIALMRGIQMTGAESLMRRPNPEFPRENGKVKISGDISSQFVSGWLIAAPFFHDNTEIIMDSPLQSRSYVDLTIDMLARAGIYVKNDNYHRFFVEGNQKYKHFEYEVEADFSQAAFWLVANELGSSIEISNLPGNSKQGDEAILEILQKKPQEIDASQIPDLVPILAVWGACRTGATTRIYNAGRLRFKESDRLAAITSELNKLGAKITEREDELVIEGVESLRGGEVDSWGDHRIAMALAIAATWASGEVVILNKECVSKSYPDFWRVYDSLEKEWVL